MTFLLNIIPVLLSAICIGLVIFFIKRKQSRKALITSVVMLAVIMLYGQIQPSYMPKTGVPPLRVMPIESTPTEMQDTLLSPQLTTEEREAHFDKNVVTFKEEVKEILK